MYCASVMNMRDVCVSCALGQNTLEVVFLGSHLRFSKCYSPAPQFLNNLTVFVGLEAWICAYTFLVSCSLGHNTLSRFPGFTP